MSGIEKDRNSTSDSRRIENEQVSESWVIVIESRIAIEKNLTKLDINYDEKKEIEVKAKSKLSLANFRANTKKFF